MEKYRSESNAARMRRKRRAAKRRKRKKIIRLIRNWCLLLLAAAVIIFCLKSIRKPGDDKKTNGTDGNIWAADNKDKTDPKKPEPVTVPEPTTEEPTTAEPETEIFVCKTESAAGGRTESISFGT